MRPITLVVALALLTGCDVDGCETFLYVGPTVVVTVQDSETGDYLSRGVTVLVTDGDFSDQLELFEPNGGPPQFEGVDTRVRRFDDVGTYTVTVSAPGYETASASSGLDAEVCSGTEYVARPAEFEIELTRAVP